MTRFRWLMLIGALALIVFGVLDVAHQTAQQGVDLTYKGQLALVQSQRNGCQRGLADRHDNAQAWYAAYLSRHRSALLDRRMHDRAQYLIDTQAAALYLSSARGLNSRTYGKYSVTLSGKPPRKPLGNGKLNCSHVFPLPKRKSLGLFAGVL